MPPAGINLVEHPLHYSGYAFRRRCQRLRSCRITDFVERREYGRTASVPIHRDEQRVGALPGDRHRPMVVHHGRQLIRVDLVDVLSATQHDVGAVAEQLLLQPRYR